jgi:uncharacterized metal-binding protein
MSAVTQIPLAPLDHAARKLSDDGVGKMSRLAGSGGRVSTRMEIAPAAQVILAIDGWPPRRAASAPRIAYTPMVVCRTVCPDIGRALVRA